MILFYRVRDLPRVLVALLAAVLVLLWGPAHTAPAVARRSILRQASIDGRTGVIVLNDRSIYVTTKPLPGEGYEGLARRATGDASNARILIEHNQDRSPLPGKRYLVPFRYAAAAYQMKAIKALFPDDTYEKGRYVHVVAAETGPTQGESLYTIAAWFTGEGENFARLMAYNGLEETRLHKGQKVFIPDGILAPAFKPQQSPEITDPSELAYTIEDGRRFAVYRLKKGEALYSSVVIRFCGRVDVEEVNALARDIARLNGIKNVNDIKVGHPIKIPVEMLSPEYRSKTDPTRVAYERSRHAPERFKRRYRAANLDDVWIILDSGHGGVDPGARNGKICEDEYCYDILCRIKERLESHTRAKVIPLIKDKRTRYRPRKLPLLRHDTNEILLSTPPYALADPRIGVNLRWCLANYHYGRLREAGVPGGKIVFVSLHADSRHPELRGAMVYIAGEEFVRDRSTVWSPVYTSRREVQLHPVAYFPRARRMESEGLSVAFADELIKRFEEDGIEVHREKPIRPFVIRKNAAWVPGVIRYNEVPTKILLEVCNMNSREDVALLVTAAYREKVARAFGEALASYYTPEPISADLAANRP